MEFRILEEEEFRLFLDQHQEKTFLQTPEIAYLREKSGWKKHYVGVFESGKLIAASMMLSKGTHFGKCEFYAPRGFLIDYENEELLSYFTNQVKKYIKKAGGYSLRIDPYVSLVERDTDGNEVKGGYDHRFILATLKKLGYQRLEKPEQVEWMYVLDLEGKTSDDILKNMKANTRNLIRKAEKSCILLQELSREELPEFFKVIKETGERKNFPVRSLAYFEGMYDVFAPRKEVKYLVAKLQVDRYLASLEQEKIDLGEKLFHLSDHVHNNGKREEYRRSIQTLEKRIQEARELLTSCGSEITLAASMFLLVQPELVYLWSGNYKEYLKFNGQYLIQWEMIQHAIQHGYKRYNFYGISGTFDKSDPYYGVYDFKRGFNGHVEQLIGEYVLPVDPVFYRLFRFIHKIKK